MIATTVLAPVASGLLTTIKFDDSEVKVLCLLGFLGLAVGIGLQVRKYSSTCTTSPRRPQLLTLVRACHRVPSWRYKAP